MRFVVLALPFLALALGCSAESVEPTDRSVLATVFDSTRGDSLIARVAGTVPDAYVRVAAEELRIAPGAEDTTLFAEVNEFDVGADGRLYVFDAANRVLFVFDSSGTLMRRVGRQGSGPGEFNSNNGMVVLPDTRLAQWDARNGRISFFSADGDFQQSWVIPTGFSTSNGIRTDKTGTIYAYRPVTPPRDGDILGRMGLRVLGDDGAMTDTLVPPDLPITPIYYIAREKDNTSATGPTHAARFQWQWHRDGFFVSVASERYEIELSRPERPLRIVRDAPTIPVSEAERNWDQERITFNLRMTDPAWQFNGPPIPATKPPVAGLFVARDGRIWVRVAVPSVEIPVEERDAADPKRAPPRMFRDAAVEFEVFESDGRFVRRVRLPYTATFMEADGDRVWYLDRDADGLPAIVRATF